MAAASDKDEPEIPQPASGTRPSMAPERDTIVDSPRRSLWSAVRETAALLVAVFRKSRLSDHLPAPRELRRPKDVLPPLDRAELMLLELMLAPVEYQRAAFRLADHALWFRENYPTSYAEELVHYACSRLVPDEGDRISIWRLRTALPSVPYAGEILPALRTLHQRRAVELFPPPILDHVPESVQHTHVRLRAPL